ncbi:hypothetical protein KY348_05900, partial [Candidatus Woesearchaeota archaeon]|nr:hypothetical protein [Candidatus Woesearchaeota archaeon]
MKQLWTILVLLMFLFSAVPLAIAEEDTDDTEEDDLVEVELEVEEGDALRPVRKKIKVRARTTRECIDELQEEYPDVPEIRIKAACALAFQRINRVRIASNAEEGSEDKPRPVLISAQGLKRLTAAQAQRARNILESMPDKEGLLENLDRARLKECLEDTEECKKKVKKWVHKKVKVKDLLRARNIAYAKLQKAKAAFEKAK